MSISTILPQTVAMRRSRLLGLIATVAAVAAAITWALSAYALGNTGQPHVSRAAPVVSSSLRGTPRTFSTPEGSPLRALTAVCSVVMCGPNDQLAARLGIGIRSNAFTALSARERGYLKSMTAVCSVIMCEPNEWLAARLGYRTR